MDMVRSSAEVINGEKKAAPPYSLRDDKRDVVKSTSSIYSLKKFLTSLNLGRVQCIVTTHLYFYFLGLKKRRMKQT